MVRLAIPQCRDLGLLTLRPEMALPSPPPHPLYTEEERRKRQAQFRRRRIGALILVIALVALVVVAVEDLEGSPSHHNAGVRTTTSAAAPTSVPVTARATTTTPPASSTATTRRTTTSTTAAATTTTIHVTTLPTTPAGDPGAQPQTEAFPTATSPVFNSNMHALWNGVVANNVHLALGGFFPESAYVKVKAVNNPAADYSNRLVAGYAADIGAAHRLLGANPAAASFVGVQVQEGYAHWVQPGTCSNNIGYFEVPNARLIYAVGGQARSFGIASMISWRGEWYVVHLGAVNRTGTAGVVDDPQIGPGVPANSATC